MSRVFALALTTAIGLATLAAQAEAKPFPGDKPMFKPVPMKPIGPMVNLVKPVFPKPVGPIVNPIKPIKPIGPIVGDIGPIKPLPPKPLPPKPFPPKWPKPGKDHHHHHVKVIYVGGQAIYEPVAVPVAAPARPVAAVSSTPKRPCLTKDYTKEGLIIFRDLCTNETATSVVPGSAAAVALEAAKAAEAAKTTPEAPAAEKQSSETTGAADFAGKSYQDFMSSAKTDQQATQSK